MHALERVYRRRLRPEEIASAELAAYLCEVSREIERQVGILANRRGDIEHVFVGDASRITLPELGRIRAGRGRFRGLRLVHTHLRNEPLTRDDLVDLALLRLDLVAAIGVTPMGARPICTSRTCCRPVEGGQPWRLLPSEPFHRSDARRRGADRGAGGGVRARRPVGGRHRRARPRAAGGGRRQAARQRPARVAGGARRRAARAVSDRRRARDGRDRAAPARGRSEVPGRARQARGRADARDAARRQRADLRSRSDARARRTPSPTSPISRSSIAPC